MTQVESLEILENKIFKLGLLSTKDQWIKCVKIFNDEMKRAASVNLEISKVIRKR